MRKYLLLSPAKINLVLQVLNKREDGYHNIYTIFQKIDLFDEIELKKSITFSLEFFSDDGEVELEENLVYKAYVRFKEVFGIRENHSIRIKKSIPIGAGLGGGSSNAATLLKGMAYLYGIDPQSEEIYKIGRSLGADVPFFISSYLCAVGEGIGDELKPYPNFSAWYILICPNFKVSTKWAYEKLSLNKDRLPIYYSADVPPWSCAEGLINDFKNLIFHVFPVLKTFEELLRSYRCCGTGLSGTGPTVFGVFSKEFPFMVYKDLKRQIKEAKVFLVKNLEEA